MRRKRSFRDYLLLVWLLAAVIVALTHRWIPEATWLMVHLVALGAITHAVMVWSAHFTAALLKTRDDDVTRRRADLRLILLAIGSLLVFIGVPTVIWPMVVVGATLVSTAVLWHGAVLLRDLKRALPGRFRISIRYYVAAACCVPVGAGFGATLAFGLDDRWHANLLVAHSMTMLLGWVGLTVVGTLVTFWPTVLRTRMDDRAEALARQAMPILLAALAVVVGGSLAGIRLVSAIGILAYGVGLVWFGRSLIAPLRKQPPREFAAASILAGALWACVALILTAVHVAFSDDIELATDYPMLASVWVVGFLVQLVTGALSYLLPSVLGGGPRVVRAGGVWFDKAAALRLTVINGGLLLWLLPLPSWAKVTVSTLVLVALASFLPIMVAGLRASIREKRRAMAGEPAAAPTERRKALTGSGLLAGVAALAVALSVGFGIDPGAAGLPTASVAVTDVTPTGQTVRVEVTAHDMAFEPNRVEVNPGDRIVIELTNEDPTNVHDLMIGDVRSPRLAVGETAELDLGVVGASLNGWCTVVGHRQMGMVFDVVVAGQPQATTEPGATHQGHAAPTVNPEAKLADIVDPVAPPLTDETLHRYEFKVTEVPLEVAPGVWQRRWTFNGGPVGPTLRGRVGDVFEITLINDGTMGHSIDFHAGAVAPDEPMRTIAPGETLIYRFTAERAGVWMYHCSTMPMSAHIAAGMHGAVIIEPEAGLPKVDREYVLVQSEIYTTAAATAEDADDVQADRIGIDAPDFVAFNGVANQYDQQMFEASVGEKVRFFVLDAGPDRASSFHIVGGQFDTLYREGGYHLLDGVDAFGNEGGGAQALALQPAEGGFVELTFTEPGHYPVVSHIMSDAERGAHGIVHVR
ncbi:nitrite reductase (NO-forming) [Tessaracoccus bendigoensis DSM 12906]|uniref:Copper-containing nitrite reductase n=1 Tax=Tessaracoccus bendigoensis DSM 12906 TaxID=1123357 RepID=A0A1M6BS27_9ACTN|nr:multicopper oxidase domain-containing protein [Tessaracoccus bendigoensis]SHI51590.1 nitrite reductase (NO-forming) [Tessaracoccus bendigoensis DSM 12906]